MAISGSSETDLSKAIGSDYDRLKDLKAFDDTKEGVKGLIDSGVTKIPRIFINPPEEKVKKKMMQTTEITTDDTADHMQIPIIDMEGVANGSSRRVKIIDEIRHASETWGFFQVVNHGIPVSVLDEMIEGVRRFFEQPNEVKMEYYTRDMSKRVNYSSNFDLYQSKAANWRDTLSCVMEPDAMDHVHEIPAACRDIKMEYSKHVQRLGNTLFELISQALGLEPNHLVDMDCDKGHSLLSHYYPPCPEPDLTLGGTQHSDIDFLTILLQDHIGGLQVLHQNKWVDVNPVPGALVINIGDLLQLISNDKLKSREHRVLASRVGPRISVACFFTTHLSPNTKVYGPIKELLSEKNPPKYKGTTQPGFAKYYHSKGPDEKSTLEHFKLI